MGPYGQAFAVGELLFSVNGRIMDIAITCKVNSRGTDKVITCVPYIVALTKIRWLDAITSFNYEPALTQRDRLTLYDCLRCHELNHTILQHLSAAVIMPSECYSASCVSYGRPTIQKKTAI